jgi:hypothetical protein
MPQPQRKPFVFSEVRTLRVLATTARAWGLMFLLPNVPRLGFEWAV